MFKHKDFANLDRFQLIDLTTRTRIHSSFPQSEKELMDAPLKPFIFHLLIC